MTMPPEVKNVDLKTMRENAGLGLREFARQLDTNHTNIVNWEKSGWINKTEFVAPMAEILGVTIEDLLGLPKSRKNLMPGGKLGEAFRLVAELPRSQQQKVIEMAEAFIALHTTNKAS